MFRIKKMKLAEETGFLLNREMKISPYKCEKLPIYIVILQALFVIIATLSSLFSFTMSFSIELNYTYVIVSAFIGTVVIYSILFIFREKNLKIPFLVMVFISIFAAIFLKRQLVEGMRKIIDKVYTKINEYYSQDFRINVSNYSDNTMGTTIVIIFISLFMIFILSTMLNFYMSRFIYMLVTLPFILISFIVGIKPDRKAFLVYLCVTIALIGASVIADNHFYKTKDALMNLKSIRKKNYKDLAAVKIGLTFLIVTVVFFTAFHFIIGENRLVRSDKSNKLKQVTEQTINDIENIICLIFTGEESKRLQGQDDSLSLIEGIKDRIAGGKTYSGGISKGKITSGRQKIRFNNDVKLSLIMTEPINDVYLKGFVADTYNNGWTKNNNVYNTDILNSGDGAFYEVYQTSFKENLYNFNNEDSSDYYGIGLLHVRSVKDNNAKILVPYLKARLQHSEYDKEAVDGLDGDFKYSFPNFNEIIWRNESAFSKDGLMEDINVDEFVVPYYDVESKDLLVSLNNIKTDNNDNKKSDLYEDLSDDYKLQIQKMEQTNQYDLYEDLPDELKVAVKKAMDNCIIPKDYIDYNDDKLSVKKTIECIDKIKAYFANDFTYSLKTDTPENKEPVAYFLDESHSGYCMYYASAATAMFRYAGIKARYVEGYVVNNTNEKKQLDEPYHITIDDEKKQTKNHIEYNLTNTYEVKDTNAHAWVEIFVKDVGWLPIEVTVAQNQADSSDLVSNIASSYIDKNHDDVEDRKNTDNEINKDNENKDNKSADDGNKEDIEKAKSEKNNEAQKEKVDKNLSNKQSISMASIMIIVVIAIVLILLAMVIIFICRFNKVKKQRKDVESKEYIKYILNDANFILNKNDIRYMKDDKYEDYAKKINDRFNIDYDLIMNYLEIVLKDTFSDERVSKEEMTIIKDFYEKLINVYISELKGIKKFYYTSLWLKR